MSSGRVALLGKGLRLRQVSQWAFLHIFFLVSVDAVLMAPVSVSR